jgi:hypothetical protein
VVGGGFQVAGGRQGRRLDCQGDRRDHWGGWNGLSADMLHRANSGCGRGRGESDGSGTLMTMRMTLPDEGTRKTMLATGMEHGMEASYVRLECLL